MNYLLSPFLAATILVATVPAWASDVASSQPVVSAAKKEPHNCLKETGSRIKQKEGECVGVPGQVLDKDDIDRTGAVSTADAIRKLAPSAR